jgi:hypothetical protein
MAGEIWRSQSSAALEVTPVTAVDPTTRRLYWPTPVLTTERPPTVHRAASGRRDNVFAVTQGSTAAGGSTGAMPVSAEESLELLSMGISATPVITTPATGVLTRLHTYKPGDLASATLHWFDGKRGWIGAGYRADTLTFAGSVDGESTMEAGLFGVSRVPGTVTPGLAERDPTFIEGWKTRLFAEAFTGTPGTTELAGMLMNWNVQISNNLSRVYAAANTQAANRVVAGLLDVTATLVFDADHASSIAELNNWLAGTSRMVRLEFQDESGFIETTLRRFITIDIGGTWTAVDISGETQGVRSYSLTFQSKYQSTMASMITIRSQAARLAAFAA